MNSASCTNYTVIHLIDGILIRLHAVRPEWKYRHGGPRQWLYVAEPKTSFEVELAQVATTLSDPSFPPSEERVKGGGYRLPDGTVTMVPPPPKLESGAALPAPKPGQVHHSVDWRLLHILSGLRAVLLVLVDSCGSCAQSPDFVGNQPWTDSIAVIKAMRSWSEEDFVPNAKYWKDWPLARLLKQQLPNRPPSWKYGPMACLFTGETGRYWNRIATYDTTRPDSFVFYRAAFGLSQSKRGFAAVPRSFVKRSLEKHARQLSTPPTSDPDMESARIFAETFFEGFRIPDILKSLPDIEGTLRACVENPRHAGGAREFLRHLARKHHGMLDSYPVSYSGLASVLEETPEALPVYVKTREPLVRMIEISPGVIVEEHGLPPLSPEDWRVLVNNHSPQNAREYLPPGVQDAVDRLIDSEPEATNFPTCKVAEVLEPLKVRLITAMDALRTHVARPLQAALWRYLRASPVFALIGEPISEDLLQDLCARHLADGGGSNDPWASGDYSAATDGLDIRFSRLVIEVVLSKLRTEDKWLAPFLASILDQQIITYPAWAKLPAILQKNGQLMGSVLSFPVLCLANFFAFIQSRPNAAAILRSRRLMDRQPVLINGDDILFRATEERYKVWLSEIAKVGFVPSVGKNFFHPRFFTVNSVPIEYLPSPTPYQFWSQFSWADMEEIAAPWNINQAPRISIRGFLNVGLLTGQAKLTGREALGALPLAGWHAGSVLEALNPLQAHKWFLHYHLEEIQRQTRFGSTTLNIFAHPLLGGLGFQIPVGVEPRFSPEQRRIARALFLSASASYEGQESRFELDSLLFLESRTAAPLSSLGNRRRRVEVELYPTGTPLPEGYSPFTDSTGVQPLAMVHDLPSSEDDLPTIARCRLSSRRIRQLIHRFDDTVDLHPLELMTQFPYTPVRVTRSELIADKGVVIPEERPFSKVYSMEIPFQDVPVPEAAEEPVLPKVYEPEDWETATVSLRVINPIVAPYVPPPLSPEERYRRMEGRRRQVLSREQNARNRGMIYARSALEQSYFEI
ncbi:RNA-dependent RNA polymerase [Changjiang narna-like virus 2]|uniref:RNA-dependent RNA polymerase n=1 Tax=Changjiang narna-like virus 2 TaxID=1922777 RepID=UPI0009095C3F|nr:RNA-dependent RNA polymerase [Changjiang narna-like virus 2]APG77108.1 RNA-dependent RNA polymerase [Changjiang narna-like virus 2]